MFCCGTDHTRPALYMSTTTAIVHVGSTLLFTRKKAYLAPMKIRARKVRLIAMTRYFLRRVLFPSGTDNMKFWIFVFFLQGR